MIDFKVILGIDLLCTYYVTLDYHAKIVRLLIHGVHRTNGWEHLVYL